MTSRTYLTSLVTAGATVLLATSVLAQDIVAPATPGIAPSFDIRRTTVTAKGDQLLFRMVAGGRVGADKPVAHGQTPGSHVAAYVWPTGLDSGAAGFAPGAGILALTVTAHPDFDDTPLYDENGDGDQSNDGETWHSHWVVLTPDEACGPGSLKVKDIPPGEAPRLPETWPGLPILLDSPGYVPHLAGDTIEVAAPATIGGAGTPFDGVTADLQVHPDMAAPLLCVVKVHDVASGDLSLPGRAE